VLEEKVKKFFLIFLFPDIMVVLTSSIVEESHSSEFSNNLFSSSCRNTNMPPLSDWDINTILYPKCQHNFLKLKNKTTILNITQWPSSTNTESAKKPKAFWIQKSDVYIFKYFLKANAKKKMSSIL
jgi:hypothetical protein